MPATDRTRAQCGAWLSVILIGIATSGCLGPRTVRTQVYDRGGIEIHLTETQRSGNATLRGFDHPATLDPAHLEAVLGPLEVEVRTRKDPKKREAAIHAELLKPLAEALSQAFLEANENQTVAVQAVRRQQRFLVLNRKALTSFNAYFDGGRLYLDLSRVDWTIPKDREKDVLPTPREGESVQKFRAVPSDAFEVVGAQKVATSWPGATPDVAATADAAGDAGRTEPELHSLSPEQLRSLADLEDARRAGSLSEVGYQRERRAIFGASGSNATLD